MRPVIGVDVPDVPECHGHPNPPEASYAILAIDDGTRYSCPQCNASHDHVFVECEPNDAWDRSKSEHLQTPVRCVLCGARECDVDGCEERRHHRGPHQSADRVIGPVGA